MCVCEYVCVYVCEKLALTSSLLCSMFYLTNSETMVVSTPTSINNHEAKLQGSAGVTVDMIGTMQM